MTVGTIEHVAGKAEFQLFKGLAVLGRLRPDVHVEAEAREGLDHALLHPFGKKVRRHRVLHVVPERNVLRIVARKTTLLVVPPGCVLHVGVNARTRIAEVLRPLVEGNAARNVDVAHDDGQKKERAGVVDAVRIVRERLRGERVASRPLRPETSRLHDEFGGNARFLFCVLGREALAVLAKFSETVGPVPNESLVVEVFLDDEADHRHGERRVGADARLQMDVRDFGGLRAAGVDRDDLAAAFLGGNDLLPPSHRLRPYVRGEDQEDLGFGRRRRTDVGRTEVELFGHGAALTAGDGRLRRIVVRTVEARQALHGGTRFLRVAAVKERFLGSVLFTHAQEFRSDGLIGFFPGDAHPTRVLRTLGIGSLHRIEKTVGIVESLQRRKALRAEDMIGIFLPVVDSGDDVAAGLKANAAHRHVIAGVANGIAGPDLV